jgi:AcrR family transcriptional regulator
MADDLRERLHVATLLCAGRSAFRFSVEDVARQAGVSRATVYRYFPGGKEQLVADGVAWEVARFFTRVASAVQAAPDLASKIERALQVGRHLLVEHEVLQQIIADDPDQILTELEVTMTRVHDGMHAYVASLLVCEDLAPGVDIDEAAEYIARLFFTYLGHTGTWDVDDPGQLRRLVRTQFVGGILAS